MPAPRSRGFSETGKLTSLPLFMPTVNTSPINRPELAVSIKVLMPLPDYKLLLLPRKLFGSSQLLDLQAHGLAQLHIRLQVKDRLPAAVGHMHVNRE